MVRGFLHFLIAIPCKKKYNKLTHFFIHILYRFVIDQFPAG